MIILDFSYSLHYNVHKLDKLGEDLTKENFRIGLLNSLLTFVKKFKFDYGTDIVVALDGNSWRRGAFTHYKFKRKEQRKKDKHDWKEIHNFFDEIIDEFKEVLPYKFLRLEGAEGDDIVAVLARYTKEKVIIIGSDKDYMQLQLDDNVYQYCPMKDDFLSEEKKDIPFILFHHIMKGDSSDGIPSVINPSNCFFEGVRQKPLTEIYIAECFEEAKKNNLETFLGEEKYKRFKENKNLIDFRCIPEELQNRIIESFENYGDIKNDMYKYIAEKNIPQFFDEINNF